MSHRTDPEGNETRALAELVDLRGRTVLEVGCGDGRLTWRYAAEAAAVLAVDPKADRIARARDSTPADLRGRVTFLEGDVVTGHLPTGEFDVAILSWSL